MSDICNYLTELSSIPNLDLSKNFSDSLLSNSEKSLFNCIIEKMEPRNILEVGTYKCGTTHLLMEASKKYGSTVFSISPFDGEHVKSYLSRFPDSKIRFMIENSMAALSAFAVNNQDFDLIFIDGDHSFNACMYDLSASSQILNIGGLIVVDNISQAGPYYSTLEFINKNPNFSLISNRNNADFYDTAFSPSRKLYFDTDFAILYKKYFHCLTNRPSAIKYSRFNIEQVPILNFTFDENSIGSIVNVEIYGSMQSQNKSGTDFLLKIFDSHRIDKNSERVELKHYSEFCEPNIDRYEIFIYAWSENTVNITNLELLNE